MCTCILPAGLESVVGVVFVSVLQAAHRAAGMRLVAVILGSDSWLMTSS